MELDFNRLLNVVTFWATRDGDQTEVDKWTTRLWRPPKGVAPSDDSPWSAANEASAFAELKKQAQG